MQKMAKEKGRQSQNDTLQFFLKDNNFITTQKSQSQVNSNKVIRFSTY